MAATTPALRTKLVETVNVCAKNAVATATQCITAAQTSHSYNSNAVTRETLIQDTVELQETIPLLVESIKANGNYPDDTNSQVELMYVAEVFLHPAVQVVQSSRYDLTLISNTQSSFLFSYCLRNK